MPTPPARSLAAGRLAPALLALALFAAPAARPARAQGAPPPTRTAARGAEDREGVRRAVLDYVEGFYEGDSTRLQRSVWPQVRKWGYARERDAADRWRGMAMAFPSGFLGYAAGVREGRSKTPPNAPKEITLFDVQDQTASAKLVAWWGIDYLLLAKENGRWMITHVLWQTPPAATAAR